MNKMDTKREENTWLSPYVMNKMDTKREENTWAPTSWTRRWTQRGEFAPNQFHKNTPTLTIRTIACPWRRRRPSVIKFGEWSKGSRKNHALLRRGNIVGDSTLPYFLKRTTQDLKGAWSPLDVLARFYNETPFYIHRKQRKQRSSFLEKGV